MSASQSRQISRPVRFIVCRLASGTRVPPPVAITSPLQAATIEGSIDNDSFGDSETAIIIVKDSRGEEFTRVEVQKSDAEDFTSTGFSIFWLVPDEYYTVEIDLNKNADSLDGDSIGVDCSETVALTVDKDGYEVPLELLEGDVFILNGGQPIVAGKEICISSI